MSFELHHRKHIEDDLTKIVRQQLRNSAHALTTSEGSQFRSAVHESRKSVKKVRAVAAFLTQAGAKLPRRDRKRLKSAARALSRVRESTAIIDTFDRVRRRYPKQLSEHTYGILRRGLVAARDRSEARAQRDSVVAQAAERLEKTGVVIPCRALAVMRVEQNRADSPGRIRNDRVLAVPVAARREVALAARVRQEIEQFFIAATVLEGKEPRILGWDDGDAALELIRSSAT